MKIETNDKPNFYKPYRDYYILDLFDFINNEVKAKTLTELGRYLVKSKEFVYPEKKKEYFLSAANELCDKIEIRYFGVFFNYQLKFKEQICFVSNSALLHIIDTFSPEKLKSKHRISVLGRELDYINEFKGYNVYHINEADEYVDAFIHIAGNPDTLENVIINEISNYLVFIFLTESAEDLKKVSEENTRLTLHDLTQNSIDLSETKDINKIRYLIELGVLEFIKTKAIAHSHNSIASLISGITGIKQTTVQPYINAYFTDTKKNNPLSNTKEMDKIKNTLNKLGRIKTK